MIVTTDIANILYARCKMFGMPVAQGHNIDYDALEPQGRVVVHVREQTPQKIWKKCFAEVNIHVPDVGEGRADLIKLNEIERNAHRIFDCVSVYDDTYYRLTIAATNILQSKELHSHYVNAKVLFQSLNTIE